MNFTKKLNFIKKRWALVGVLIILWIITLFFLIYSIFLNKGHLVYTLDDAYIHMAIAKNFSQHGVWGITGYNFSSSSSSLLFTSLLSFFYLIFGVNEITPLIINIVVANLLIYYIYRIFKKDYNVPSYLIFISMSSMIIFAPIPRLIMTGMEHLLHCLITVVFINVSKNQLTKIDNVEGKNFFSNIKYLLILAPLVAMIRYEGMFLIIAVSFLFLFKRKFKYSIIIAILGFLPVIIFGLISILNGGFLLPNSLIIKGTIPDLSSLSTILHSFIYQPFQRLLGYPHLFLLLVGLAIIVYITIVKKDEIWSDTSIMSLIFIAITVLQIEFASSGIRSRYDAYLIVLGIFIFTIFIKDYLRPGYTLANLKKDIINIRETLKIHTIVRKGTIVLVLALILSPFIYRSYYLATTAHASNNIYEQQYQMGLFLKEYYEGESVVLNDIGATNYFANIKCLDLLGLGSNEVAKKTVNNEFNQDTIDELAREKGCKIAIINWNFEYLGGMPSNWTLIGTWTTTKNNWVTAGKIVDFFAIEESEINNLRSHLQDFSSRLPDAIIESGNYTL